VRYEKGETELLVLVTASLVEPLSLSKIPAGPGSLEVPENDWEIYLNGSIEGKMLEQASYPQVFKELGLERLKGPGAWAGYRDSRSSKAASQPEAEAEKKD
jgi:hypothetical protein